MRRRHQLGAVERDGVGGVYGDGEDVGLSLNVSSCARMCRDSLRGRSLTYSWAIECVHVAGEEGVVGGGLACIVEVSLDDTVVASSSVVELYHITHGSLDLVGSEGQETALTDHDLDGSSASLHCQAGSEEDT